ncbi:MAG: efflux RND transporter permease subunit [Selenomonadaceae bacterium]|nr:efflux RND transporter permease subunit [Selenomonadaceae bacterium]
MRNLTEVSLHHKNLIWYFIIVIALGGVFAFRNLGRMEDPNFIIRQMIVSAAWPGATAEEMAKFVAEPLEKKLQDTPGLDYIKSESRPGEVRVFVYLKDTTPEESIRPTWLEVRNLSNDAARDMPENILGPFFNDRFDDVFGSIYAITGDEYSYEELRVHAEQFRRRALEIDSVQKVELVGVQAERVYVEISSDTLANLGVGFNEVKTALEGENLRYATANITTDKERVYVRYSGAFSDFEAVKNLTIPIKGNLVKLGDIATVELRDKEPGDAKMFFNGKKAVGVKISMENGGNILKLGKDLNSLEEATKKILPLGMEIGKVADQPGVVEDSIDEFTKTLLEAIVIVLLVSFFSLGTRTGLVVACSIPLVLAAVFLFMYLTGIDLHKVSLGALIISLGLLVDDAIIAVEMMSVKLEEGLSRFEAACYAFNETAMPMLTGTLITVAGFIPVAFSKGLASEFCAALFPVIGAALIISWIVSVMVAPFFGTYLIKTKEKSENTPESRFYRLFRRVLEKILAYPKTTVVVTVFCFALSLLGFTYVKQEFFPASVRPEILLDLRLSRGTSITETERKAKRLAAYIDELDGVKNYVCYVGEGAPRFVLTVDPELPDDNFAQFVITAESKKAREELQQRINVILKEEFYDVKSRMHLLETGPPAKAPVMLRISGEDFASTKESAIKAMNCITEKQLAKNVTLDANEETGILKLDLDQGRLSALGLTRGLISQTLYGMIDGAKVGEYYLRDKTVPIEARLDKSDRDELTKLNFAPIRTTANQVVTLSQAGELKLSTEPGLIPRRNLRETITLTGELPAKNLTANNATKAALNAVNSEDLNLPEGISIEAAGALEDSAKSLSHIVKPLPLMIFVMMTLLMFQLRCVKDMTLALLTAPMGLIGVTWGMLILDEAMGFVADLGFLALMGMIIRNSVILIDQIKKHIAKGETPYDAIIDSAIMRFRPIMLTAMAAILGMLPLMPSVFWGPMATVIASGLLIATILTLLVLPAMYMLAYGVKKE